MDRVTSPTAKHTATYRRTPHQHQQSEPPQDNGREVNEKFVAGLMGYVSNGVEAAIQSDKEEDIHSSPTKHGSGMANYEPGAESTHVSDPPPDGGLRAWMTVFGTHLAVMNTWGVINSFGAFQTHYVTVLQRPPADISWIGSVEIFLLLFVGALTGRLTDAGYFRFIATLGSVLIVAGTMAASACTQYWRIFLAQGVCVGLGNGCVFCPTIALMSTYFLKRRSLAIGLTACGSATGGILFPILVRELLPRIGFGWTMRSIGFFQAGSLAIALICLKPRVAPRKAGPLIEWAAFRELEYSFYAVAAFLCFWGSYVAFFYVAAYSRDVQGLSYSTSLELLMIMNGAGTIGRLLPNHLADRFGSLTVFVPTAGSATLIMFCWIPTTSTAGLYVWAAFCGIGLGGIQAMFPAATASLTVDPRKQGTRIGMMFTIVSFSVLTGPPIAGVLFSAMDGRYLGAQSFAGASIALGTVFMLVARETKRRKRGEPIWSKV